MNEIPPFPSAPPFKDRRVGLLVFGILEVLLGALFALMVPLVVFSVAMSARTTRTAPDLRMLILTSVFYVGLAVMFVWLGIGSIRCRRWARALWLILAWSWLVVGLLDMGFMAVWLPKILGPIFQGGPNAAQRPNPALMLIPMIVMGVMFFVMLIVIPTALVIFYRSRDVLATCEARDPKARWTDGRPLPLLAVTCWLWLGAVMMLAMPLAYRGVIPFFGALVSGLPGMILYLGLAALWGWLGWQWYQAKPAGWWVLVGTVLLLSVSNILTFAELDLTELYRQMGYPEATIKLIQQMNMFPPNAMLWWCAGAMVPILGYLVWVKRFFHAPTGPVAGGGNTTVQ